MQLLTDFCDLLGAHGLGHLPEPLHLKTGLCDP